VKTTFTYTDGSKTTCEGTVDRSHILAGHMNFNTSLGKCVHVDASGNPVPTDRLKTLAENKAAPAKK